jgi:hypothetical protein
MIQHLVLGCKKKKKTNGRSHAVTREYCGSPSDDEHVTGVCYMCNCHMYLISVNIKVLEVCLLVICLLENVISSSDVSDTVVTFSKPQLRVF